MWRGGVTVNAEQYKLILNNLLANEVCYHDMLTWFQTRWGHSPQCTDKQGNYAPYVSTMTHFLLQTLTFKRPSFKYVNLHTITTRNSIYIIRKQGNLLYF